MSIEDSVRTLRIIIFALIAGVLIFMGVAWFVELESSPGGQPLGVLIPIVPVLAVGNIVLYFVLRSRSLAQLRKRMRSNELAVEDAKHELPQELRVLPLLGAALAEGASLFGIIVFWLTREFALLAVPVLGVLCMIAVLPSRERYEGLIEAARRDQF